MATIVERERTRVIRNTYRARITKVVKKQFMEKELYRKEFILKDMVAYLMQALSYLTPEQFNALSDDQLKRKAGKLMSEKLAFGMLDDLSPEEMKIFDDAVAGR